MKCSNLFFIFYNLLTIFLFKIGIVKAIIGGKDAELRDFKYIVSVQADGQHICSGSFIGDQHVLTAAQCVMNEKNLFRDIKYTIIAGVTDLNADVNIPERVVMNVERVYVPNSFRHITDKNQLPVYIDRANIALLKLVNKLDLTKHPSLDSLYLPEGSIVTSRYLKDSLTVVGFGIESLSDRRIPPMPYLSVVCENCRKLKFAETSVIDKRTCNSMLPEPIQKTVICSQMKQRYNHIAEGVCDGDVGSPLIILKNIVIGVLVRGPEDCNEKYSSSAYTRVGSFLDFINEAMKEEFKNIRVAHYVRSNTPTESESLQEFYQFLKTN